LRSFVYLQGRNIHTDSTICNEVLRKISGHKTEGIMNLLTCDKEG